MSEKMKCFLIELLDIMTKYNVSVECEYDRDVNNSPNMVIEMVNEHKIERNTIAWHQNYLSIQDVKEELGIIEEEEEEE